MRLLIKIWLKMSFCVTNKVGINAVQGDVGLALTATQKVWIYFHHLLP